eukprot:5930108-Amphidinium_carterae.3
MQRDQAVEVVDSGASMSACRQAQCRLALGRRISVERALAHPETDTNSSTNCYNNTRTPYTTLFAGTCGQNNSQSPSQNSFFDLDPRALP